MSLGSLFLNTAKGPDLNPGGIDLIFTGTSIAIPQYNSRNKSFNLSSLAEGASVVFGRKTRHSAESSFFDITQGQFGTFVSREHFKITRSKNQYLITDLASSFGTKVNGEFLIPGEESVLPLNAKISLKKDDEYLANTRSAREALRNALFPSRITATLHLIQDDQDKGEVSRLDPTMEVVIGRAAECQIVVPDDQVSRRHCRIYFNPKKCMFVVEDLGSRNGTYVNKLLKIEKDAPWILENGHIIALGRYERIKLLFSSTN